MIDEARDPDAAVRRVDFGRPVVPVLGLPIDAITLDDAVERIRRHAFDGVRCFVSTPNLNFAVAAWSDPPFRDTVLRSDLSLADGMPLVWIARLCGTPVPERVAGADVFEALQAHAGPPINVFLFGGPAGAGEAACAAINRRAGGLRCVGFDPAGFGSIESMSGDAMIDRINRSDAHFLVASLGARKGQAWLAHNADRLRVPVLAHLGAALNFAAGTVRRAPRWMRWSGVEWLWRIKEEPSLWRRYWHDGWMLVHRLTTRVLPDVLSAGRPADGPLPKLEFQWKAGEAALHLRGLWRTEHAPLVQRALADAAARSAGLRVDVSAVDGLAAEVIGSLLIAAGWFGDRGGFRLVGRNPAVEKSLRRKLVADALLAR